MVFTLESKAREIRIRTLQMIYRAKTGHIGGDFSEADILVALYYKYLRCSSAKTADPDRDRFILSKGHCVETLYNILADQGYFPEADLETYSVFGSRYIGHPNNKINGIEMNTGSLGHGLAVGAGMALAGMMDGRDYRVYVLMGDGELDEGSVWEAAMLAAHYRLRNLIAIIDRNGLQISGPTEEVMAHNDLALRWRAFGWNVLELADGNRMQDICQALEQAQACSDRPTVIIAHTVKGCGCPSIEDQTVWHHKIPAEQEYENMLKELKVGELHG